MPPRTYSPIQPLATWEQENDASLANVFSEDDNTNRLRLAKFFDLPSGCHFKKHTTTTTTETDEGVQTSTYTIEYKEGRLVEVNESVTHHLTESDDSVVEVEGKVVSNTTTENGKLVECEESNTRTIVTTVDDRTTSDEKRVQVVTHTDEEVVDRDETMTHIVSESDDSMRESEESVVHITVSTPGKVIESGDVIVHSLETFGDETTESDRSFIYCTVTTDEKAINKEEETIAITETDAEGHTLCTDTNTQSVWEEIDGGEIGTTKETTHTLKMVCDQVEEHRTTRERRIDSTNEALNGWIEGTESSFVAIEGSDGASAHVETQESHFVGTTEDDQYNYEQHDVYSSYVDAEEGRIPLRDREMMYVEADTEGGYQISVRSSEENDGHRSVGNREIFFETVETADGQLEDVERKDISYTETEAEDGATLLSLKTVSTDEAGLRTTEERDSFIAVMAEEEGDSFIAETDTVVKATETTDGTTEVTVKTEDTRNGEKRTSETEYSFVTDSFEALDGAPHIEQLEDAVEEDVMYESFNDEFDTEGVPATEDELVLSSLCSGCLSGEECVDGQCAPYSVFDASSPEFEEGEDAEGTYYAGEDADAVYADELEDDKGLVEFQWPYQGSEVMITGSFCDWDEGVQMRWSEERQMFLAILPLTKGETFEYMFIVDGEPKYDCETEHLCTEEGTIFNYVVVNTE